MKELIKSKSVAIVGNAQSLFTRQIGDEIDSHDVVCRINRGIKIEDPACQGHRTDIWAYGDFSLVKHITESCQVRLHLSQFRTGIFHSSLTTNWVELDEIDLLKSRLAWDLPSSGLILIHHILLNEPSRVTLCGFDWKSTPTWTDSDEEKKVISVHNWKLEKDLVTRFSKEYNITIL